MVLLQFAPFFCYLVRRFVKKKQFRMKSWLKLLVQYQAPKTKRGIYFVETALGVHPSAHRYGHEKVVAIHNSEPGWLDLVHSKPSQALKLCHPLSLLLNNAELCSTKDGSTGPMAWDLPVSSIPVAGLIRTHEQGVYFWGIEYPKKTWPHFPWNTGWLIGILIVAY